MEQGIKVDIKRMITLVSYLTKGLPKVKVGIIGDKATVKRVADSGEFLTNAQIGFVQEFGVMSGKVKIPARSFIDMPLRLFLNDYLKKNQNLTKEAFEKAVQEGKAEQFAKKVGAVAEEVIQDAFETSGFGKWKANSPSTIKRKKSSKPLIDTGELRKSISSEVIK